MNILTAKWQEKLPDGKILCTLCPRYCKMSEGQHGFCFIRKVENDRLVTLGYGKTTGFGLDPIEKKPLNHFYPGSLTLSFGTAGCNLGCKFCQNWEMSKSKFESIQNVNATPKQIVELAIKHKTKSIAYTYNDPTIFGEFVIDCSKLARENGLKNILVTAGYIDKNARKEVYQFVDAVNIDLKGFTEDFYWKQTYSHLNDVLDTIIWLRGSGLWFEVTTLLIPGLNDSPEEIKNECEWLIGNAGESVPLHFTAFHPDFKMIDRKATPASTLMMARSIALSLGMKYVYTGNVHNIESQTTFCPSCHTALIERDWHAVNFNIIENGYCPKCRTKINGYF